MARWLEEMRGFWEAQFERDVADAEEARRKLLHRVQRFEIDGGETAAPRRTVQNV